MTEQITAPALTPEMIEDSKWILNNSLHDGNYKDHLARAPLEEIEYCLTKEKRKTGRINLEWEKEKRLRQKAQKEKEEAKRRQDEAWNKTVEAMPPPPSTLRRTDLFGNTVETLRTTTSTGKIQGKEPADYEEENDDEPIPDDEMPEEDEVVEDEEEVDDE